MGEARGTCGGRSGMSREFWWGLRGADSSGSGYGQVTFYHSSESSDSTKFGEFLNWLRNCQLLKKVKLADEMREGKGNHEK